MKKIVNLFILLVVSCTLIGQSSDHQVPLDKKDRKGLSKEALIYAEGNIPTIQTSPILSTNDQIVSLESCDASYIPVDTLSYTPVPRNDDGSYKIEDLGFSFSFCGSSYSSVYINTNGNLSFLDSVATYDPLGFPYEVPMVAPFWADVDTRNEECGQIWFKLFPNHLIVTWEEVGWYDMKCVPTNSFQVIISDGTAPIIGLGNNIQFRYGAMEWTTGEASGGSIFGGFAATVGFNSGDNENYAQIGRFNKDSEEYDGPGGEDDGVHWLDDSCFTFDGDGSSLQVECQDIIRLLDSNCEVFLSPEEIASSFGDACNSIELSLDNDFFSCDDLGENVVTITASTDTETITCTATVNIAAGACEPPSIEVVAPVCSDAEAFLLNASPAGGLWSGATNDGWIDPALLGPGAHQVSYGDVNPCGQIFTITIDVFENPQVEILAERFSFCEEDPGEILIASANGGTETFNYTWNTPTGTFSVDSIMADEPGIYTLKAVDGNGCSAETTIEIFELARPVPVIFGNSPICTGQTTILEAEAGYTSYEWSNGATSPSITVDAQGTYGLTVSDAAGCTGSTTFSLMTNSPPTAEVSEGFELCNTFSADTLINFYDYIISGDDSGFWVDNDNSGATGDFDQLSFANTPVGTYTFTYSTNSAISPCDELTFELVVEIIDCACPEVAFITPPPICNQSSSLALNDLLIENHSGVWSLGTTPVGETPANILEDTFFMYQADPGTYELYFTISETPPPACPTQFTVSLQVEAPASAGIVGMPFMSCDNDTHNVNLHALIEGEDMGGKWSEVSDINSLGAAFDADAGSFNISNQPVGIYRFEYSFASVELCGDNRQVVEVHIYEIPFVEAGDIVEMNCSQDTLSLDATMSVQGEDYLLEWLGGVLEDGNENSLTPNVNSPGIYTLSITDLNTGCVNTDQVEVIEVFDFPIAHATVSGDINCANDSVNLNSEGSQTGPSIRYEWEGSGLNGVTVGNSIVAAQSGTFILTVIDSISNCRNSDTLIVKEDFATPDFELFTDEELGCTAGELTPEVLFENPSGAYAFNWTDSLGIVLSNDRTLLINEQGLYTLEVFDLNNGCAHTQSIRINEVENVPHSVELQVLSLGCETNNAGIGVREVEGGYAPYLYALDDAPFSLLNSFTRIDTGDYHLRVQDANGCEWDTLITIEGPAIYDIDLGPDQIVGIGDEVNIILNSDVPFPMIDTIIWSTDAEVSCIVDNCFEVSVQAIESFALNVEMMTIDGCVSKDEIKVIVDKNRSVFIPNIFSPNDDGVNDRFVIFGDIEKIQNINRFTILDRWGGIIYEQKDFLPNDYSYGWDGRFKGQDLGAGVFDYSVEVLFIDGTVEMFTGYMTLAR